MRRSLRHHVGMKGITRHTVLILKWFCKAKHLYEWLPIAVITLMGNLINRVCMWILSRLYIRVNVGQGILLAIITGSCSAAMPQLLLHGRRLWFLQLCFILDLCDSQVCFGCQLAVSQTSVTPAFWFQDNMCSWHDPPLTSEWYSNLTFYIQSAGFRKDVRLMLGCLKMN